MMTIGQAIDYLNELDLDKYIVSAAELDDIMDDIEMVAGRSIFDAMGIDDFAFYLRQRGYRVMEEIRYYIGGKIKN